MSDPYRPVAPQARTEPDLVATGEVRSQVEQFARRLYDLGATPDEVAQVVDNWDRLDPDDDPDPLAWTRERRARLLHAGDHELAGLLAQSRAEYEVGTVTEEDAAERARTAALEAALAEAAGRIGSNVGSVTAWVGGDPVRAEAVLRLELAPEGKGRATLVGPLADLVGWDTADVDAVRASYGPAVEPVVAPEGPGGATVPPDPPQAQGGAQGPASEGVVPDAIRVDPEAG